MAGVLQSSGLEEFQTLATVEKPTKFPPPTKSSPPSESPPAHAKSSFPLTKASRNSSTTSVVPIASDKLAEHVDAVDKPSTASEVRKYMAEIAGSTVDNNFERIEGNILKMVEEDLGYERMHRTKSDDADPYDRYLNRVSRLAAQGKLIISDGEKNLRRPSGPSMDTRDYRQMYSPAPAHKEGLAELFTGTTAGFKDLLQIKDEKMDHIQDQFVVLPKTQSSLESMTGQLTWPQIFDFIATQPQPKLRRRNY